MKLTKIEKNKIESIKNVLKLGREMRDCLIDDLTSLINYNMAEHYDGIPSFEDYKKFLQEANLVDPLLELEIECMYESYHSYHKDWQEKN